MKKRILSLLIILALCMTTTSPVNASIVPFTDVPSNAWYTWDVIKAVEAGIIDGKGNGKFAPSDNVTMGEAVKLAAVLHAKLSHNNYNFTQGSPWYDTYLDYLNETDGYRPQYGINYNSPASRDQFARLMSVVLETMSRAELTKNTVEDGSIPDVPNADVYSYIYDLYRAGILAGNDKNGNFKPNTYIQRSEVSALVNRIVNADERKSIMLSNRDNEPSNDNETIAVNGTYDFYAYGDLSQAPSGDLDLNNGNFTFIVNLGFGYDTIKGTYTASSSTVTCNVESRTAGGYTGDDLYTIVFKINGNNLLLTDHMGLLSQGDEGIKN